MRKILLLFAMLLGTVVTWASGGLKLEDLSSETAYLLKGKKSGLYMTLMNDNAEGIQIKNFTGGDNQLFYIIKSNDKFNIKNKNGKFLQAVSNWDFKTSDSACDFAITETDEEGVYKIARTDRETPNANGGNYVGPNKTAIGDGSPFYSNHTDDNDNCEWVFEEVPDLISVTYTYKIDDRQYASEKVEQPKNSAVSVPAMAFLSVVGTEGTIGDSDCEIIVNCKEDLPFILTTDLNSPVWQVVEMHRYGTFRVWDYQANDNAVKVTDVADKENAVADNMLWCFTGNLIDGFKVYNKAAGTEVTLNATAANPMVGAASNGNDVWKLAKSTATNDPAACFTNNGSNYMNQNGGQIKYHSAADNGSTCYFYNPADFVLAEYASIENVPVGAVGSYILSEEMRASLQTANSAVEANPSDIEKVQALAELVKGAKSANKVSMSAGYYFVKATGGGNTAAWYLTHKVSDGQETLWAAAPSGGLNADYVWKFETAENGYKMLCTNLNAYYNIKTATNGGDNNTYVNIASAADAEELTLEDKGLGKFVIKNTDTENIRTEGNGQVNYWSGESNETWYIIPATAIDITIGEAGYATTYLPFDVTLPNTVKAYAVNDIEGEYAKMENKTDIPAKNGAILEGKGTHTLTIAEANSDWSGNLLEGTFVNTYVGKGAYVLAKKDGVIGFYKAAMNFAKNGEEPWAKVEENGTHFLNNANKAYLPASAVTANARFISFDFGTETAIDELKGENGNVKTVIYNLSGRRVQGAQKGIFIVNGKKVVK